MYRTLSRRFPDTFAVFRKCPAHYSAFNIFDPQHMRGNFDARKMDELGEYLAGMNPDVVINCIGLTTRKLAANHESEIIAVNALLPHKLKEWCLESGKKLIHFSTDCVFSGKSGPYKDDHFKDAKDLYGQSKALGEVGGDGILTIRSSIIGLELEGKTELLEWFVAQKGKSIKGFRNVMYSGVTTNFMSEVVLRLLHNDSGFGGVHQLASEPISKFELLTIANKLFKTGAEIEALDEPHSNKVLVQSAFFNDLGIHPPTWRDQLKELSQEINQYERWGRNGEDKRKAA